MKKRKVPCLCKIFIHKHVYRIIYIYKVIIVIGRALFGG